MKQKTIRKVFAFLALFAIVASLVWVGILSIVSSYSRKKQIKTQKVSPEISDVKIDTKNSWEIKIVNTTKEKKTNLNNVVLDNTKK